MSDKRKAERLNHLYVMRATPCGCELCERAAVYEFDAGLSRGTAEKLAAGAKTLSETDVGGGQNALQQMVGGQ